MRASRFTLQLDEHFLELSNFPLLIRRCALLRANAESQQSISCKPTYNPRPDLDTSKKLRSLKPRKPERLKLSRLIAASGAARSALTGGGGPSPSPHPELEPARARQETMGNTSESLEGHRQGPTWGDMHRLHAHTSWYECRPSQTSRSQHHPCIPGPRDVWG